MLAKILLIVALSLSVSCFAESGGNKSRRLLDSNDQRHSSTDTNQQKQQKQQQHSDPSTKKRDSQSTQEHSSDTKPSMVDYCREHTC